LKWGALGKTQKFRLKSTWAGTASLVFSEIIDGVLLFLFLPEGEVLLEEFDDGLGISESFLVDVIDLFEGIGQGCLTELAGLLVVVHHLVVEHGEVQSKTEPNWVAGVQRLRGSLSLLVILEGTLFDSVDLVLLSALGDVSVIVTNHLEKEGLGLVGGSYLHALALNDIDDGHALVIELLLDILLVLRKPCGEFLVLGVLLDGADRSNGGSFRANLVLEPNREKVSLFGGEVLILVRDNFLEVCDHIVESFSLFGDSGHKNIFFQ